MKRQGKLLIIGLTIAMVLGLGILYMTSSKDVNEVVDEISENYELRGKSVGRDDHGYFIYINLKNREEIPEVEKFLQKNLSNKDLKKYKIQVTAIPREK